MVAHGFPFQNRGATTEKASYFWNHVNLSVIVYQALKSQQVPVAKAMGHDSEGSDV